MTPYRATKPATSGETPRSATPSPAAARATAAAIISYAIYAVNSPLIGSRMLATAPSVLYGIFRYLYLIYDRRDTRSTSAILIEDPGMIFAGVSWIGTALAMLYIFD